MESQLFPSAPSVLHFSSYPLLPLLGPVLSFDFQRSLKGGGVRLVSFSCTVVLRVQCSERGIKSVKTGISRGLNVIDCMTEMPEIPIIKLPKCNTFPRLTKKKRKKGKKEGRFLSALHQVEGDYKTSTSGFRLTQTWLLWSLWAWGTFSTGSSDLVKPHINICL